jgi:DNA-binding CsgD family transcriptional regulator
MNTKQSSVSQAKARAGRRLAEGTGFAMFSEAAWEAIARSLELSSRELQIVRGVFDDQIEYAIAADLKISPHTVHMHLNRLFKKLTVTSRTELVLRIKDDLLNMDPAQIVTAQDHELAYVVYSGLVRQNVGSLEIVPDLHLFAISGRTLDGDHVSVHAEFVSWGYVAVSSLHGLGWIVGLLALAALLFHRRDFV